MTTVEIKRLIRRVRKCCDGCSDNTMRLCAEFEKMLDEVKRLQEWVSDLQSGVYINCVYCGHRYGPDDEVLASMADVLKEHIEQCPKHPMSQLKTENIKLRNRVAKLTDCFGHVFEPMGSVCLDMCRKCGLSKDDKIHLRVAELE